MGFENKLHKKASKDKIAKAIYLFIDFVISYLLQREERPLFFNFAIVLAWNTFYGIECREHTLRNIHILRNRPSLRIDHSVKCVPRLL